MLVQRSGKKVLGFDVISAAFIDREQRRVALRINGGDQLAHLIEKLRRLHAAGGGDLLRSHGGQLVCK